MKRWMPKYVYECNECEGVFETRHSLQELCLICKLCKAEGTLYRKPSTIFISKKQAQIVGKSKPGEVVKSAIEEARMDLRQEQQELKVRKYKNDK